MILGNLTFVWLQILIWSRNLRSIFANLGHDVSQAKHFSSPRKIASVSSKWKYNAEDSQLFADHDKSLLKFLSDAIPEALQHTGMSSFDEHLRGVQAILRKWEAPQHLCDAGLFHSIYGTEGFQGYKLSVLKRPSIRLLIGPASERLVWIFCMVDRYSVDQTVMTEYAKSSSVAERSGDVGFIFEENNAESSSDSFTYSFTSRAELGCFPITLDSKAEWLDFLELSLADWLEQVEGAAEKANPLFEWKVGEAWSYRREAYRCMASVLQTNRRSDVYVRMWEQVYAQEGPLTRGLSQPVTPPVSQAAREAREAMQARHI